MADEVTYKAPSKENAYTQPELVTAQGNVKIRITTILVVGVIVLALLIGGLYAHITDPIHAKDLWLIIGPIMAGALSGLVGIEIGQKTKP